jgi:hypothetical protein
MSFLDWGPQALEEASSLSEVKQLRDCAEAVRVLAKLEGREHENRAAEIKLRAERKAGGMLTEFNLRGGDRRSRLRRNRPTLASLHITKDQSHYWQRLALVPRVDLDRYIKRCKKRGELITLQGALHAARSPSDG